MQDNTYKLYIAITRARERMMLTYIEQTPDVLDELVKPAGSNQFN